MKQEEKDLLLKDLCARLTYGVKIHINSCIEEQNQMPLFDVNLEAETIGVRNEQWAFRAIPIIDDEDETKVIKPYLRSRSKMTKEERDYEVGNFMYDDLLIKQKLIYKYIEWLNSRHIDYNGLIEKGLALEAPENMYNLKKI